ncbi:protein LNK2-like isoform X2 [Durio zibethinus]|uniref:Protein LNK2-like isoform X2 n=1 Tax=Durio zibethinus TaxID=66656 RepID=A0A6P5Z033_DURZI|nr:protein LNK2-like isoform X2 [Durio zibethinus]
MFDWNDEELTNIIWDEAGETDDHIVPCQEGSENCHSKKEWSQVTATIKSTEQKTPGDKVDLHGRKLEGSSKFNTNGGIATSGFGMGSWPELSLYNAAKTAQDLMGNEVSNNLVEVTKCSSKNETTELSKDPEFFQNPNDDKEQGDFVDYSWANIGSFDDLDRIFSNDDPIFANISLGSADELWSSSKEVTNGPGKSVPTTVDSPSLVIGALTSISEHLQIKGEHEQQDNQSFTLSYGKLHGSTSHGLHNMEFPGDKSKSIIQEQTIVETAGKTGVSKSHLVTEKVMNPNGLDNKAYGRKKRLKFRKKPEEIGEAKLVQDLYGTWISSGKPLAQYENNLATSMVKSFPSSVVTQQRQLRVTDSLQYQHISNTFVAPSTYGNLTNQYPAIPVLSNVQSGEFNQQPLLSCYGVSPGKANHVNRSVEAAAKPLSTMTPQEKIEKLRRRQQMQALLAIQIQQQQFAHQVPCTDHSVIQKSTQENQFQYVEGADVEDLSTLASFDPNSPLEQDDSNTVSIAINDYAAKDTVLYQLQDVIAKLDVRIRLCIRDSLFRLAQNVMQRHYASDTSSTNKSSRDESKVAKEENKNYNRMSDAETETNPIDRTVAHLLFHRPPELSGKHTETPESPASTKFSCERKSAGLMSLPMGCISDNSQVKQNPTHQASKVPSPLVDPQHMEQFKNSPCIDTSENASDYGPVDVE